jgi:hypothetical protein
MELSLDLVFYGCDRWQSVPIVWPINLYPQQLEILLWYATIIGGCLYLANFT